MIVLACLILLLVTLACSCLDETGDSVAFLRLALWRAYSESLRDYCQGAGSTRYTTSDGCIEAARDNCPNSNLSVADTCIQNWINSPPPVVVDCSSFRITAPLDGLADGMNTIYWDGVPDATGYQIDVLDTPNLLLNMSLPAQPTNVTLDLSQSVIGGGVSIQLQMRALIGDSIVCRTAAILTRAWPMPPAQPVPVIPLTPAPFCGNLICEPGEDLETCVRDCG
jgi:hypothetical protein